MIQLKLSNLKGLEKELKNKLDGLEELARPAIRQRFSEAAYAITKRQFTTDINRFAAMNPERLNHVYEWGRVGDNKARLFEIMKVSSTATRLSIATNFLPSKSVVPLDPKLSTEGSTGKSIHKRSIFRDKAQMMESGKRVSFIAKGTIAFVSKEGETVFRSRGQRISHGMPEGTQGQFEIFLRTWYLEKAPGVIARSRIFEGIERATANALNTTGGGAIRVREEVIAVIKQYELGGSNV